MHMPLDTTRPRTHTNWEESLPATPAPAPAPAPHADALQTRTRCFR